MLVFSSGQLSQPYLYIKKWVHSSLLEEDFVVQVLCEMIHENDIFLYLVGYKIYNIII